METLADKNSLLSSQKSSESGLQAVLHPLVLLTISDYITRHTLRKQSGPIIGALIGQQNGREVTIEHAFECATLEQNDDVILHAEWFAQRLDQMKQIHKSPQLDLVGWYTVLPKSGPTTTVLPIHTYLLSQHNESSLLLGFHPEEAVDHSAGSKLPLTIYESIYEVDEPKGGDLGEDKEMWDGEPPLKLKFRELPYSVETGEAEMISMDFVARGAGNATVSEQREQQQQQPQPVKDSKGKQPQYEAEKKETAAAASAAATAVENQQVLSKDDEEMIAALTAKANSVKMLQSRINLLTTYLERLPPSYLSTVNTETQTPDGSHTIPSHTILRSIQALVNRLSLVVPSNTEAFKQEMLSEANDVHLMGLLNDVMQSMTDARSIGKKFNIVEASKVHNRKLMMESAMTADRSGFMAGAGDLSM